MGFPVAQLVKNLPDMQETQVQSLGWENPLEKGKATHSSIWAWRIPWGRKELDATKRLSLSPALQVDSLLTELLGKPIGSDQNHSQEEKMQKGKMVV